MMRADAPNRHLCEERQHVVPEPALDVVSRPGPQVTGRGQPPLRQLFEPDLAELRIHPRPTELVGLDSRGEAFGVDLAIEPSRTLVTTVRCPIRDLPSPIWLLPDRCHGYVLRSSMRSSRNAS